MCTLSNLFAVRDVNYNMKTIYPAILLFTGLFISCDHDEVTPVKETVILPLRLELDDYKREFTIDSRNRISTIRISSYMPNEVVLETNVQYFYTSDGKLEKTVTDNGFELVYHHQDGLITRTDEYLNGQLSQYHTFSYDDKGRLQQFTTWQDIPEYGGVVAKAKEVYVYDNRDNLTNQFLYTYNSGTQGHDLLSSFEFSDYDNNPEAESLFSAHAFNPQAAFRKNNPGKAVTKNRLGNMGMIDQYSYVYDARGYVTEKTTTVTYAYNGNTGSFKSFFFYQER